MENALSVGTVVKASWSRFKPLWQKLVLIFAILFVCDYLIQMIAGEERGFFEGGAFEAIEALLSIAFAFISSYVGTRIGLMVIRGEAITKESVLSFDWRLVAYVALASIISGIAVIAGLALLIVPGMIIAVRTCLGNYFIIDEKLGPIDAIKASWNLTKGHGWPIFALFLVFGIVGVVATVVTAGLAAIVIFPLGVIAGAHVYLALKNASLPVAAPAAPVPEVKA